MFLHTNFVCKKKSSNSANLQMDDKNVYARTCKWLILLAFRAYTECTVCNHTLTRHSRLFDGTKCAIAGIVPRFGASLAIARAMPLPGLVYAIARTRPKLGLLFAIAKVGPAQESGTLALRRARAHGPRCTPGRSYTTGAIDIHVFFPHFRLCYRRG